MQIAEPQLYQPSTRIFARINNIDLLRGLVMIIMALDHTRDLFHNIALTQDALNLQTTTPALFFTRWITHFCAPVFVFLTGTSIYLQSLRKSKKELSIFLVKRGLWLVFVEIFIMTFLLTFDIHYSIILLAVIWAIGVSMIILGLLIWLPYTAILTLGLIIVFGHNALDFYEAKRESFSVLYMFLHRQAFMPLSETRFLGALYPLLPWIGLMMVGFCFGRIYEPGTTPTAQKKRIALIGYTLIILFVLLRAINVYGDPSPWSQQQSSLYSFLSFINTTKYPPSLLFMCMTMGPALLFLAYVGPVKNGVTRFVTYYGKVPFFYYVMHFFILHVVTSIFTIARGHSFEEAAKGAPGIPFKFVFPNEGFELWGVYITWILVVLFLYPLCKWFAEYKARNRKWWLSYL